MAWRAQVNENVRMPAKRPKIGAPKALSVGGRKPKGTLTAHCRERDVRPPVVRVEGVIRDLHAVVAVVVRVGKAEAVANLVHWRSRRKV